MRLVAHVSTHIASSVARNSRLQRQHVALLHNSTRDRILELWLEQAGEAGVNVLDEEDLGLLAVDAACDEVEGVPERIEGDVDPRSCAIDSVVCMIPRFSWVL